MNITVTVNGASPRKNVTRKVDAAFNYVPLHERAGLDDRGSVPARCRGSFSSPLRTYRLWNPASLLSNGRRGLFPRG